MGKTTVLKMAKSNQKILSLLMLRLLFVDGQGIDLLGDGSEKKNQNVMDLDQIPPEIEDAIMASPLAETILDIAPNFLEVLYKAMKCAAERFKQFNPCNFNGTFDPFTNVKECSQTTGFTDIVNKIQGSIPALNISVGVPEYESQSRCFNPQGLIDSRNLRSTLLST